MATGNVEADEIPHLGLSHSGAIGTAHTFRIVGYSETIGNRFEAKNKAVPLMFLGSAQNTQAPALSYPLRAVVQQGRHGYTVRHHLYIHSLRFSSGDSCSRLELWFHVGSVTRPLQS